MTLLTFWLKMIPKPHKTIDFIDFYWFWDSSAQSTVGAQESQKQQKSIKSIVLHGFGIIFIKKVNKVNCFIRFWKCRILGLWSSWWPSWAHLRSFLGRSGPNLVPKMASKVVPKMATKIVQKGGAAFSKQIGNAHLASKRLPEIDKKQWW